MITSFCVEKITKDEQNEILNVQRLLITKITNLTCVIKTGWLSHHSQPMVAVSVACCVMELFLSVMFVT